MYELDHYFNSIKVRLEHYENQRAYHIKLFQFHKGTIRTVLPVFLQPGISHFNSIKVRLELPRKTLWLMFITFQFHKGTIRTNIRCGIYRNSKHFNSIKVRLELIILLTYFRLHRDFNSIKVRLELSFVGSFCTSSKFQFHKGTIRTVK